MLTILVVMIVQCTYIDQCHGNTKEVGGGSDSGSSSSSTLSSLEARSSSSSSLPYLLPTLILIAIVIIIVSLALSSPSPFLLSLLQSCCSFVSFVCRRKSGVKEKTGQHQASMPDVQKSGLANAQYQGSVPRVLSSHHRGNNASSYIGRHQVT